jgi:hypothetical protein
MRKSDARAQWQQSTVLVAALHHHADQQALWHYRRIGVQPDRTRKVSPFAVTDATEINLLTSRRAGKGSGC